MSDKFEYKGYTGISTYDAVDNLYYGRIIGTKGIMGFHGYSIKEAEEAFHSAVNAYIEFMGDVTKND